MKPRSHSLNHVVWVTMSAIDAAPTIRVQMKATTWSDLRATDMGRLEGLAHAEVDPPPPRLRLAVDQQVGDRVHLIAEIKAQRSYRRHIAEPWSYRVAQITDVEIPRVGPHVAEIDERNGAEPSLHRHPRFQRTVEHREPADRKAEAAE